MLFVSHFCSLNSRVLYSSYAANRLRTADYQNIAPRSSIRLMAGVRTKIGYTSFCEKCCLISCHKKQYKDSREVWLILKIPEFVRSREKLHKEYKFRSLFWLSDVGAQNGLSESHSHQYYVWLKSELYHLETLQHHFRICFDHHPHFF